MSQTLEGESVTRSWLQRHRAARILVWLASVVAAVVLLFAAVAFAFVHHFNPSTPKHDYATPSNALEAQRQDVDYFARLIALDRAFAPGARHEAEARLAALRQLSQPLDAPHLRVALMQIDALADNGHSRMGFGDGIPKDLPVRVAPFADGLYVMRAKDADADLLGGRIVAVDGMDIDHVLQRLETLRGGPPQWRRLNAANTIVIQDLLYGAGVAPDMNASTWTVETPAGAQVTRRLEPYTPASSEPSVFVKRWFSSEPFDGLQAGWRSYAAERTLPLTLTDFDTTFRSVRLPGSCTMLIQLKSNDDTEKQNLKAFLGQTESDLRARPPCNLILDLRFNDGGNYTKTYRFAKKLPGFVDPAGRIFVLTSPITFSAGITTTAFVKQAGGDRVTILGEPVGDRLHFYSEGGRGSLPNLKAYVAYETGKHDYQNPCTDLNDCFWLNYIFAVRVKSLDPDETIPWTIQDWNLGRDRTFDRALELAAGVTERRGSER